MEMNTILFTGAIATLLYASYADFKFREVEDYVSIGLIVFALTARLFYSIITSDASIILYGIVGFSITAVIGILLYATGQWGGGDAKLLMGIGAVIGLNMMLFKFIVLQFIAGAVFGVMYNIYLISCEPGRFRLALNQLQLSKHGKHRLHVTYILLMIAMLFSNHLYVRLAIISPLVIIALFYLVKTTDIAYYVKKVSVKHLQEGDWLANDVYLDGKMLCKRKKTGLSSSDIVKLNTVKYVTIREGIPFVPAMLIALIMVTI